MEGSLTFQGHGLECWMHRDLLRSGKLHPVVVLAVNATTAATAAGGAGAAAAASTALGHFCWLQCLNIGPGIRSNRPR